MATHETIFRAEIIDLLLDKNTTYPNWTIVEDKRSGIDIDSFIIFKKNNLFLKVCCEKNKFDDAEATKTLGIAIERFDSLHIPNFEELFKYSYLRNSFNIPIAINNNLSNEDVIQLKEAPEKIYKDSFLPFLLMQENHIFKDFFQSNIDLKAIFSTYLDNTPKRYHSFLIEAPFVLDYIHDKLVEQNINAIYYNDCDNCIYSIKDNSRDYFVIKSQSGGYLIEKIKEGEFIGFYFGEDSIYSTAQELLNSGLSPQLMSFKIEEHELTQYDSLIGYTSYTMAGAVLELKKLEAKKAQVCSEDNTRFDFFNYYGIVQEYQKIRMINNEKKLLINLIEQQKVAPGFKI